MVSSTLQYHAALPVAVLGLPFTLYSVILLPSFVVVILIDTSVVPSCRTSYFSIVSPISHFWSNCFRSFDLPQRARGKGGAISLQMVSCRRMYTIEAS